VVVAIVSFGVRESGKATRRARVQFVRRAGIVLTARARLRTCVVRAQEQGAMVVAFVPDVATN